VKLSTNQLRTIIKEELAEVLKRRTLLVFDFDDTIAHTNSKVFVKRNNEKIGMDSGQFANYKYQPGDELDFSDFDRVEGSVIPHTLQILKDEMKKGHKVVVITARPPGAIEGIKRFFEQNEIEPPDIYATSGSSNKPPVLRDLLDQENYSLVVVYEDCEKNIESLKSVAEEMDVPYAAICVERSTRMRKVHEINNQPTPINH